MKRRLFLVLLLGATLAAGSAAAQEQQQQQVPPDRVNLEEFKAMLAGHKPVLVLDVRGAVDRKIKGAQHLPLDQLESRLAELPRDREIITYCS